VRAELRAAHLRQLLARVFLRGVEPLSHFFLIKGLIREMQLKNLLGGAVKFLQ